MRARAAQTDKFKKACDQCSFRKTKCSGSLPCSICISKGFSCCFSKAVIRKQLPGKRIHTIRQQNGCIGTITPPVSSDVFRLHRDRTQFCNYGAEAAVAYRPCTPEASNQNGQERNPNAESSIPSITVSCPGTQLGDRTVQCVPGCHEPGAKCTSGHARCWGARPRPCERTPLSNHYGCQNLDIDESAETLLENEHVSITEARPNKAACSDIWPSHIGEEQILKWVGIFFDRIYAIVPVLGRSVVFKDLTERRHRRDQNFAAMLLSLSALSLIQPIYPEEHKCLPERQIQANSLLHTAARIRANPYIAENVTVEAILTSYFMFSCMFGMSKHNAAWFHLREAVDLASFLELDKPESYQRISTLDCDVRLRLFLLLSITERGYAIQRSRQISFKGHPIQKMQLVYQILQHSSLVKTPALFKREKADRMALLGLLQLMKLQNIMSEEIIECWNGHCFRKNQVCSRFAEEEVTKLHSSIKMATMSTEDTRILETALVQDLSSRDHIPMHPKPLSSSLHPSQWADIYVLQQWLHNRLWTLCLSHGLLSETAQHSFLRFSYSTEIATETLEACLMMSPASLEVHGYGMIERLYDIASSAALILNGTANSFLTLSKDQFHRMGNLLEKYLVFLGELRGGDHPYLKKLREQYVASMGLAISSANMS